MKKYFLKAITNFIKVGKYVRVLETLITLLRGALPLKLTYLFISTAQNEQNKKIKSTKNIQQFLVNYMTRKICKSTRNSYPLRRVALPLKLTYRYYLTNQTDKKDYNNNSKELYNSV